MSKKAMLTRLAFVGLGGVAAILPVLTNSAVASAKPSMCSVRVDECNDIPPDVPNHPGSTPFPPYQGSYPTPGVFDSSGYFPCPPRTIICD